MMAVAENIFEHVIRDAVDEEFTELLALNGVRIERIVSTGQTSSPEFWYDQAWSEWGPCSPDRPAFCSRTNLRQEC